MHDFFKQNYGFSDYQIAQLGHLSKTLLSELSKLLIMGIIFVNKLDIYIVSIMILLLLRTTTGGIHCKTYFTCLLSSFMYMFLCIEAFPLINIPLFLENIMLFLCAVTNFYLGPATSAIHRPLTKERIKKGRIRAAFIILCFLFIKTLIPECKYIPVCFWIIVIHTLQLIYAKIQKKGEQYETEIHSVE